MAKVVVIGGGWAGCAAAISASKAGAQVVILEKTDLLIGLGNVGGIMRNNGRYTACEEAICLGASELFTLTDENATHKNVNFPGHDHATVYNVLKIEPQVRKLIKDMGIEVRIMSRVVDVDCDGDILKAVILEDGERVEGDSFVDTTGSSGPMGNCTKYGNGCAMCVLRCPSFGGRVSVTARCGVNDMIGERANGDFGAFSGSMKLLKESLSEEIQKELKDNGFAVIPLPVELRNEKKLDIKVCQQYALHEFAENIILLDTGHERFIVLRHIVQNRCRVIGPYTFFLLPQKSISISVVSPFQRISSISIDNKAFLVFISSMLLKLSLNLSSVLITNS